MAYASTAARNRMGVTGRGYRLLHRWACGRAPGFSGRHEDMSWAVVAGVTGAELMQLPDCGFKTLDEIAAAMREAGLTLPDHPRQADAAPVLHRGDRVFLPGRSRPLVVDDFATLGEEVLLRLKKEA